MKGSVILVALSSMIAFALAAPAQAQVVQLPTFQQFSVSTSVMVPDRGSAVIGGVDSAREGVNEFGFGPFRNRGIGREFSSSRVGVTASILDMREIDEMILGSARGLRAEDIAMLEKAEGITREVARTQTHGVTSVSALKQQRLKAEEAKQQEVLTFIERGDAMQKQGKLTTAKTFYRMALKRANDQGLRANISLKLAQLEKR